MNKQQLKIDWATHQAATYACKNWHYSKSMSVPPLVKVGAWEDGKFIGVVLFSRGANNNMLKPFGLQQTEGCELTRVALNNHISPVSRIIRLAIIFLKKTSPSLKIIVSFADENQGHHGGIYQAGNWIYTGQQPDTIEYIAPDGKQWHGRMVSKTGKTKVFGKQKLVWRHDQCKKVVCKGKHRYLMPLDDKMREQIQHLSKPYPKRVQSIEAMHHAIQHGEDGATPICTLQEDFNDAT